MKEIKAIIQPFLLQKVIDALKEVPGLPGVTVDSGVKGFGKSGDDGTEYVEKVKLEIVVPNYLVEEVIEVICANAHTGRPGDGKIFVYTVDEVVKIRTRERGGQAI